MIEPEKRRAIYLLHEEGMSLRDIARRLGVSRNTARTIIKERGTTPAAIRRDKIRIYSDGSTPNVGGGSNACMKNSLRKRGSRSSTRP
jgi:IS30 family transposase